MKSITSDSAPPGRRSTLGTGPGGPTRDSPAPGVATSDSGGAGGRPGAPSFTGSIGRGMVPRLALPQLVATGTRALSDYPPSTFCEPGGRPGLLIGDLLGKTLVIAEKPSVAQDIVK